MRILGKFAAFTFGASFGLAMMALTGSEYGVHRIGTIIMVDSGACPNGYDELTAFNGKFLLGTLNANGDIGTTGGTDSVTPSGTVGLQTLTMNSYTPAGTNGTAPFTPAGTNSTSTVTPLGTNSTSTVTPTGTIAWPAGVPTIAWPAGVPTINEPSFTIVGTKMTTSGSGTASATSFNGTTIASGNTTVSNPAQAIAWPAGVPTNTWPAGVPTFTGGTNTVGAQTFTGSSSTVGAQTFTGSAGTVPAQTFTGTPATLTGGVSQPAFTGNSQENRPAFVRVIFCKKNATWP